MHCLWQEKIHIYIKNSTNLIIFLIISSKWIKSLTKFYWRGTNLCQRCTWNSPDLPIVLVDQISSKNSKQETRNLRHLYRNELDKACFAQKAEYSDSKEIEKGLFQKRFWKMELMKLLEIINMIYIKEH